MPSRIGHSLIGLPIAINEMKKKLKWILIFLGAAALAAALWIFAWSRGVFLPKWIQWETKNLEPEEDAGPSSISLKKRRVIVEDQGKTLWESPENVLVQDFLWCDIDHDQTPELILLCWRIGRYGNARPFWVEHDELAWSQHIYIYDWRDEEIHALWMASDIGMDVVSFAFNDTDRLVITETNQRQTSWDWISWGLSFLKELAPAA